MVHFIFFSIFSKVKKSKKKSILFNLDHSFALFAKFFLKKNKTAAWIIPCSFGVVAYLLQIWWLEVRGEIEFSFPQGTYSLYFRLHLGKPSRRRGRRNCMTDNIHGWDLKPVRFQLSTLDGQQMQSKAYLAEPGVWSYYHVGDFVVKRSDEVTHVRFSLLQIDCTHTKGGLCVDSVLIEPKGLRQDNIYCA